MFLLLHAGRVLVFRPALLQRLGDGIVFNLGLCSGSFCLGPRRGVLEYSGRSRETRVLVTCSDIWTRVRVDKDGGCDLYCFIGLHKANLSSSPRRHYRPLPIWLQALSIYLYMYHFPLSLTLSLSSLALSVFVSLTFLVHLSPSFLLLFLILCSCFSLVSLAPSLPPWVHV